MTTCDHGWKPRSMTPTVVSILEAVTGFHVIL